MLGSTQFAVEIALEGLFCENRFDLCSHTLEDETLVSSNFVQPIFFDIYMDIKHSLQSLLFSLLGKTIASNSLLFSMTSRV